MKQNMCKQFKNNETLNRQEPSTMPGCGEERAAPTLGEGQHRRVPAHQHHRCSPSLLPRVGRSRHGPTLAAAVLTSRPRTRRCASPALPGRGRRRTRGQERWGRSSAGRRALHGGARGPGRRGRAGSCSHVTPGQVGSIPPGRPQQGAWHRHLPGGHPGRLRSSSLQPAGGPGRMLVYTKHGVVRIL